MLLKAGLFTLFAAAYVLLIDIPHHTDAFFVLACLVALLFNIHQPNIVTWVGIIMTMRAIELVVFLLWGDNLKSLPMLSYGVQVCLDVWAILLINKRWYYYYKYYPNARQGDAYSTNADFYLIIIYALYTLVGVLSMIESAIRKPSRVGLPDSWGNPDVLLIYTHFEMLKAGITLLLLAALWGSITEYFKRSNRFLSA